MREFSTRLVQLSETGGPEVLKLKSGTLPPPKGNQVLLRHHAVGVNFIDTYYRSGLYSTQLPSGLGKEGAGIVEMVGEDVQHFRPGDRVAHATGPLGSYASRILIDEKFLVKIPDLISFELAASLLLKGLTVQYLFKSVYPLRKGEKILFHASAGGVGVIASQWAKAIEAELIGTVSTQEKAEISKSYGAWEVIDYSREDVVKRVLDLTNGEKLPVVFDSVGKATWEQSLDCLKPRGLMVSFGNASGAVTGLNLSNLSQRGSLFLTRPLLADYMSNPNELQIAANDVFSLVLNGSIQIFSPQIFPLHEVQFAHRELMNRNRVGSIILSTQMCD
jgi:NADPH2:quinone reductase